MSSNPLPGMGWVQGVFDDDAVFDYMKGMLKTEISPWQMDVMQNIKDFAMKNPIDRLQTLPMIPCVTVRPSGPASYAASFDERVIGTPHPVEDLIAEYEMCVETMARLIEAHQDEGRCLNTYKPNQRPCRVCRDSFDNEWAWYHTTLLIAALEDEFQNLRVPTFDIKTLIVDPPTLPECTLCQGAGCEEECGFDGGCEMAFAGPDSHRVCRRCTGSGLEPKEG